MGPEVSKSGIGRQIRAARTPDASLREISRKIRTGLRVLLFSGAVAFANGLTNCTPQSDDHIGQTSSAIGKVWDKNTPKDNTSPKTYWITADKGYRLFITNDSSDGRFKARISTTDNKGISWSTPTNIVISDTGIPVNSVDNNTWSVMACKGGWCGVGRLITSNDRGVLGNSNIYYYDWDELTYKASKGTKMPAPVNNSTNSETSFGTDPSGTWGLFGRLISGANSDIYQVKLGDWSSVKPVKGLDTSFVEDDPSFLSSTEILFTSDRPGGKGGTDVWLGIGYDLLIAKITGTKNFVAVNTIDNQGNGGVDTRGEYCWSDEATDPEGGPSSLKIKCDPDVIKTIISTPDAGTDSATDAVPDAPSDSPAETTLETGVKPEAGDSTVADSPDAGSDATTDASMDSGSGDADADGTDGATDSAETGDGSTTSDSSGADDTADTAPDSPTETPKDTGKAEISIGDTSPSDTPPETPVQCSETPFNGAATSPSITVTSCDLEQLQGYVLRPTEFRIGSIIVKVESIYMGNASLRIRMYKGLPVMIGIEGAKWSLNKPHNTITKYAALLYGNGFGVEDSATRFEIAYDQNGHPVLLTVKAVEGLHTAYKVAEGSKTFCDPWVSGRLSDCPETGKIPEGQTASFKIAGPEQKPSPETKPGCGPCNTIGGVRGSTREQVFGVFALLSLAAAAARRRKHGRVFDKIKQTNGER